MLPSHVGPLYSAPQLHSNPPLISVQDPPFCTGSAGICYALREDDKLSIIV